MDVDRWAMAWAATTVVPAGSGRVLPRSSLSSPSSLSSNFSSSSSSSPFLPSSFPSSSLRRQPSSPQPCLLFLHYSSASFRVLANIAPGRPLSFCYFHRRFDFSTLSANFIVALALFSSFFSCSHLSVSFVDGTERPSSRYTKPPFVFQSFRDHRRCPAVPRILPVNLRWNRVHWNDLYACSQSASQPTSRARARARMHSCTRAGTCTSVRVTLPIP